MPILTKQKVRITKVWIEIPIKDKSIPNKREHYLVSQRVADYIVLLESKLETLPKLRRNKQIT